MPWDAIQETAWYRGVIPAVLVFLVLSILLLRSARGERRTVLRASLLMALSVLGSFAGAVLGAAGLAPGARWAHGLAVLLAGIGIIQLAGAFVFGVFLPRLRLTPPRILQDVVTALALLVWGLVRLHSAGVDLASIVTTSAVLTAVIGFSLQDTLGNIVGGLALQMDQSVQVGDWIELEETPPGRVVEIRWRQTSIETRDWETVVIPNSMLMKNKFVVLGRRLGQPVQQRQWIPFNIDYRQAPSQVIDAVNRGLRNAQIPSVARQPEPTCLFMDATGGAARYAVAYWLTDLGAKNPTDSEVRLHIYSALKRNGIPFAVPSQNVLLFEETSEKRAFELERDLQQRVSALRAVDLFNSFSFEELRVLAERLKPAPFARGDVLTRQGAHADWLYVVTTGKADVFVENEQHDRAKVTELGPGSFLGEMGLMTGEPRAATVVAQTEMETYRLDKKAFQQLIISRPEAADQISTVLARRRAQLEATLEHLDAEGRATWTAHTRNDIRAKIRNFFGLEG